MKISRRVVAGDGTAKKEEKVTAMITFIMVMRTMMMMTSTMVMMLSMVMMMVMTMEQLRKRRR